MNKLTLASKHLQVEVLPELGAKISSLRWLPGNEELFQQPLRHYALPTRTMAFDQGDASGMDECIPTVSGCEITTANEAISLPDHGDFWRVPFHSTQIGNALTLQAEGFSLPLRFEKRLALDGNRLRIGYMLQNVSASELPYLWSAHPGFAAEADDRILLPSSVERITVWYSGNGRLGAPGQTHVWPETATATGSRADLSLVGSHQQGVGDKIFAAAPPEGWVALERKRFQRRIEIHFDPEQCPYVGLWLSYGGWPEGQTLRQQCVALEPCTAPADSLAAAMQNRSASRLAPGAAREWSIEIRVIPE